MNILIIALSAFWLVLATTPDNHTVEYVPNQPEGCTTDSECGCIDCLDPEDTEMVRDDDNFYLVGE